MLTCKICAKCVSVQDQCCDWYCVDCCPKITYQNLYDSALDMGYDLFNDQRLRNYVYNPVKWQLIRVETVITEDMEGFDLLSLPYWRKTERTGTCISGFEYVYRRRTQSKETSCGLIT